jgi:hypothetical protein
MQNLSDLRQDDRLSLLLLTFENPSASPTISVWLSTARDQSTAVWSTKSGLPFPICSAAPTAAAMVILVNEGANDLNETIFYLLFCQNEDLP